MIRLPSKRQGLGAAIAEAERKAEARRLLSVTAQAWPVWIELKGRIPSKKNLLKPRSPRSRGRRHMYDEETRAMLTAVETQARIAWGPHRAVPHPRVDVYFETVNASQDRDGIWTTVLDCLKRAGVIHDDSIRHFNGTVVLHPAKIVAQARLARVYLCIKPDPALEGKGEV